MPTTLVAIRIPDELLERIDAEGKRSTVIIRRLQGSYSVNTATLSPKTPPLPTLATLNPDTPDRLAPYQRLAHAIGCTCWTCKPPSK
jgi:hypothetical protein